MNKYLKIVLVLLSIKSNGQSPEFDTEKLLGNEESENEMLVEDFNSYLLDLIASPPNLNEITPEFFSTLPFVTPNQVKSFFRYRNEMNGFGSIYELQTIPGWDIQTCRFVSSIGYVSELANSFPKGKTTNVQVLLREERDLEKKKGFTNEDNAFAGSRDKISFRISASRSNNYAITIAGEKDAGERFKFNSFKQVGFDHTTGNLTLNKKGIMDKLIIGDYRIQFGQGLIHGSSFGGGKGNETIYNIRQPNSGIRPSASFGEWGYLHGIALTLKKGKISLSPYGSIQLKDATVRLDSLTNEKYVTGFIQTGLHRTAAESANRKSIREEIMGLTATIDWKRITLGAQYMSEHFSLPISYSDDPYKVYSFKGKSNSLGGMFLNFSWQNLYFFNETVINNSNGIGTISGLILSISKDIDFAFSARYFSPRLHSYYSKVFAESSSNNEEGLYWGIKWMLSRKILISGYFDLFKFPWLRYQVKSPSSGNEFLFRCEFIDKNFPSFLLFKKETKKVSYNSMTNSNYKTKTSVSANLAVSINEKISGVIRIGASFFDDGIKKSGFLIKQGLKYKFKYGSIDAGYILFDINSFDASLYLTESDIRYKMTVVSFNDQGYRYFAKAHMKMSKNLSFWIKYNSTTYTNKSEIGSGNDLIAGRQSSQIKTQLIYTIN